ncbi:MAG: YgjV family protein [bacterium]|nr:YgjV family protein [bacterium]
MFIIFGIIGLLIISFAIWFRNERKQDILFVIGGVSLLIYSISIGDFIFIILQIVFIISASIELLQLHGKKLTKL